MLRGNVKLTLNAGSRDVVLVVLNQGAHNGGLNDGIARSCQKSIFNLKSLLSNHCSSYLSRQKLLRHSSSWEDR